MGIREMLCRFLVKLVMRATGYQTYTACRNLQLCAGLDSDIDETIHLMEKRRSKKSAQSRREKNVGTEIEDKEVKKDTGDGLRVDTDAT